MKTQIGITEANRHTGANLLGKVEAEEDLFYIRIKNTYWDVDKEDSYGKHKFLESHLQQLDEIINNIA